MLACYLFLSISPQCLQINGYLQHSLRMVSLGSLFCSHRLTLLLILLWAGLLSEILWAFWWKVFYNFRTQSVLKFFETMLLYFCVLLSVKLVCFGGWKNVLLKLNLCHCEYAINTYFDYISSIVDGHHREYGADAIEGRMCMLQRGLTSLTLNLNEAQARAMKAFLRKFLPFTSNW